MTLSRVVAGAVFSALLSEPVRLILASKPRLVVLAGSFIEVGAPRTVPT